MESDSDSEVFEDCENSQSTSNFYDDSDSSNLLQPRKKQLLPIQYSSEEESEIEREISDSDENWIEIDTDDEDNVGTYIPFTNTGCQIVGHDQKPIDFFKKFITDELIGDILTQTNLYANEQIRNKDLSDRSMWQNWQDVSCDEMNSFIGVILNMGTIIQKDVKDYFSKNFVCSNPFFSNIFSRERFLKIFWMLHLSQNQRANRNPSTRYSEITNFIKYIDLKFRKNFIPGKEVCVDEAVVPFKGRFNSLTYSPNKPPKWGIRIYVLVDSNTGYVYSVLPYFGSYTTESLIRPDLPVSARIVLHLYNNLLETIPNSKGYHLYVDRYYTSVPLAEELLKKKCHLTGTIRSDRKFLPQKVKKPIFNRKNVIAFRSRNKHILVLSWKDKRNITMLSTYDTPRMKTVSRITRGGVQLEIKKPEVVLNYNKFMGGVDRADHYGSMYPFLRKSLKW